MAKYRIPSDYKNDVARANHNWQSPCMGTGHCGFFYPVHHRHLNAKDRIRGRIESLVQSQAIRGPLLNGFKQITFATFTPDRFIYGWMGNGMRFTPEQYQKFSHWTINPAYFRTNTATSTSALYDNYLLSRGLPKGVSGLDAYQSWIYDGYLDGYDGVKIPRPTHVGRGGLFDWLGIPAGTVAPVYAKPTPSGPLGNEVPPSFNFRIEPFVAYFLSYYYYVANMQEDDLYYSRDLWHLERSNSGAQGQQYTFTQLFEKVNPNLILLVLDALRVYSNFGGARELMEMTIDPGTVEGKWPDNVASSVQYFLKWILSGIGAHGGLFPAPYNPDLFNNIIKVGSAPTASIPVVESGKGDTIAVPELRLQTKIQNMLDRLFVSSGRFGDVLRTLWGTKSSPYINKPDFLGIWASSINPSNVVAQSSGSIAGDDGSGVDLGQMAARIDRFSDYRKGRGIDYYAEEPGTFMVFSMLVPEPAYTQGLHPDMVGGTFADDFNPEMKGIGFLSVPRHRYTMMPQIFGSYPWAADPNSETPIGSSFDPNLLTVGDTVAWDWLRTDYPRLHGEFAQNGYFQYWTLVRQFTEFYADLSDGKVTSVSSQEYVGTYVNPLSWQYIFTAQSLTDPNFTFMFDLDFSVTSSVPANYMPYLGR